jgi:hypothetical protein
MVYTLKDDDDDDDDDDDNDDNKLFILVNLYTTCFL